MPAGRPLKFDNVIELQKKIDKYFAECDPHMKTVTEWVESRAKDGTLIKDDHGLNFLVKVKHRIITKQEHYTITGLALALNTSRETLLDYENKDQFSDTIKAAKLKCQQYAEKQLYGNAPTGSIFSLKNNYGWRDQTEVKSEGEITYKYEELDDETLVKLAKSRDDQTLGTV